MAPDRPKQRTQQRPKQSPKKQRPKPGRAPTKSSTRPPSTSPKPTAPPRASATRPAGRQLKPKATRSVKRSVKRALKRSVKPAPPRPAPLKPAAASPGSERRQHRRAPASFPCVLKGPDRKEERFDLVDLSESGVRMRCPRALAAMTQIEVALVLPAARIGRPKDATIATRGVVVWSHKQPDGYDTGVFFPELGQEQRVLLATYVLTAAS